MDRVVPHLETFRKHLIQMIEKLSTAFPELFKDTKKDVETLADIISELRDEEFERIKMLKEFRKTTTFKFALRYLNNVSKFRDRIKKRDITVFDEADFPNYVFPRINLDLRELNKLDKSPKKEEVQKVLIYLTLLAESADKATELFTLSDNARKQVQHRKRIRQYQRSELKKHIYNIIGAEGQNESMDKVINTILDEFETNYSHLIGNGNVSSEEITQTILKLYHKLAEEYQKGKLKQDELYSTFKSLYKNVIAGDDVNLGDTFSEIKNVLNLDDDMSEEKLEEMLKNGDIDQMMKDKGINVEDMVQKIQKKVEEKIKETGPIQLNTENEEDDDITL